MNNKTGKKMNVGGYVAIAKEAKGIAPKSVDAIDEKIASRIKPKVSPVYYNKGGNTNNMLNGRLAKSKDWFTGELSFLNY